MSARSVRDGANIAVGCVTIWACASGAESSGLEGRDGGAVADSSGGSALADVRGASEAGGSHDARHLDAGGDHHLDAARDDAAPPAIPTTCSDGAAVAYARTSCPGVPEPVPGPVSTQAGFDSRGQTLMLAELAESSLPCFPTVVCVANGAPTMLFSDSPESPSDDGILYADVIGPGAFRAYVYHTNSGNGLRKFPVVLLNQGMADVHVNVTAEGVGGPSQNYLKVGEEVIAAWLGSRGMSRGFTVAPGMRVLLDADLDAVHAGANELAHAIIDFTSDGSLKASVVSLDESSDATTATATLSLLPQDGLHVRGTFPGAALEIEGTAPIDAQGARRIRLGAAVTDPALAGHDDVDDLAVTLAGNFGVSYALRLTFGHNTALLLAPRGGSWGGVGEIPAGIDAPAGTTVLPSTSDSVGADLEAVVVGAFPTGTVSGLTLLTAGGSSLPVDLLTIPLTP